VGALDQAWQVREHERAAVPDLGQAEVRGEGGERVGSDLHLPPGHPREERRFPHVGEPDDPDVGQDAELEPDPPLLSLLPELADPRGLAGGIGERLVPTPAASPPGDAGLRPVGCEVGEDLPRPGVADHGAHWNVDHEVGAILPLAAVRTTVAAVAGAKVDLVLELEEGPHGTGGTQEDIPPPTAAPAVGGAAGIGAGPVEADESVPPPSRGDMDLRLIDPHSGGYPSSWSGSTFTYTRLCPANRTVPVVLAKIVKSRPMPTPKPG